MDGPDIARARLQSQQIVAPAFEHPAELVRWLGAVQAQDYLGALWSVGLRLPGATEAAVERALAERTIVRTWPQRGTLHFVAAEDVRWLLKLLTPRVIAGAAGRFRQLELDEAVFDRSRAAIVPALQSAGQLPRSAVFEVLHGAGVATAGQRGITILWRLAQEGLLCFGTRQGKQPTFALLDAWVPQGRVLPRDKALAELARRYFTSHGPATLRDFQWWSGLTAADARSGLEQTLAHLTEHVVEGRTYWMAAAMPAGQGATADMHLLPGFDEYLLGYTDCRAALDPGHARRIHPGNNGMFSSTIVAGGNGRVVGAWKRVMGRNTVSVTFSLFEPLNAVQQRGLVTAAERYAAFLGLALDVRAVS